MGGDFGGVERGCPWVRDSYFLAPVRALSLSTVFLEMLGLYASLKYSMVYFLS